MSRYPPSSTKSTPTSYHRRCQKPVLATSLQTRVVSYSTIWQTSACASQRILTMIQMRNARFVTLADILTNTLSSWSTRSATTRSAIHVSTVSSPMDRQPALSPNAARRCGGTSFESLLLRISNSRERSTYEGGSRKCMVSNAVIFWFFD
jgi:hypothetical protein